MKESQHKLLINTFIVIIVALVFYIIIEVRFKYGKKTDNQTEVVDEPINKIVNPRHIMYDGKMYRVYLFNENDNNYALYDTTIVKELKTDFVIINGDRMYLTKEQIEENEN